MDLDTVDDAAFEMMKSRPQEYVQAMTYKIVHYLAMASGLFFKRLRLKWGNNEVGHIYLQEILAFELA